MVGMPGRRGEIEAPKTTYLSQVESQRLPGLSRGSGVSAEMLPALVQMLPGEDEPSRLLLVELLARTEGEAATAALAQRAIFDLSPTVRQAAVAALKKHPAPHYRPVLLNGLRYPWAPVADFAAEALVALADREAVPQLKTLLQEPDPHLITVAGKPPRVREVVRINHLRNCMLCHAAAVRSDEPVLGVVPTPGQALSPVYYAQRGGGSLLVRADVTYLRQDFSAALAIEKAAPWPAVQRFDFLVRTRPASAEEVRQHRDPAAISPQREAVLFALRELGGAGSE
jgi:hypothetical protein